MKKPTKQTPPKEKQFVTNPFTSLKALKKEEPAPKKKTVPRSEPQKPATPPAAPEVDDAVLFLREVADVQRLHATAEKAKKEAASAPPRPPAVDEEERKVFLGAFQTMDVRFEEEIPDDVEPLRPVHTPRMKRLKRGALRIEEQLDLHGLSKDEAVENLGRFLKSAFDRRRLAVLIITGKGNNSPGEPVLQGAVASWLRTEGRGTVAEFSPAPAKLGGSGAFVVFLREKQAVEEP